MSWIVKLTELNKYVYSKKVMVENPVFARKFTDKKTAKIYIKAPEFANAQTEIIDFNTDIMKEKLIEVPSALT
jgi:hypothetical protein